MLFFFTHTATTAIYTLSLHDALPIYGSEFRLSTPKGESDMRIGLPGLYNVYNALAAAAVAGEAGAGLARSEEHTSELQSQSNLVCRLLLEKKKNDDSSRRARRRSACP